MSPRKETCLRIADLIAGKSLTIPEMAQLLGVNPMGIQSCANTMVRRGELVRLRRGIQSCANTMVRRGELVRLRRALGQPFAYRLPEKKRAA